MPSRRARPTPEDDLVLLLLRRPDCGRDDPAFEARVGRADPQRLLAVLVDHRLAALLGRRLVREAGDALGPGFRRQVEHRSLQARRLGGLQQMVGDSVRARLESQGIAASWLKGPALSQRVHGDPGLRESGDIDLLVAPERLAEAVTVVHGMGWGAPADWTDREGRPLLHFALLHDGGLPPIELHWRVHWYERSFAAEALARGATVSDAAGITLRDEDLLVFLLLFYARDGLAGVRLAADVLALSRGVRSDGHAAAVAREHPELAPALAAAIDAVSRVGACDHETLGGPVAMPSRVARWGTTLADPLLRMTPPQRLAERALLDVVLAPGGRQRWTALRRGITPPREVLARTYPAVEGAGPVGVLRAEAEHAARMLRRLALAPVLRMGRPTALGPRDPLPPRA